MEVLMKTHLHKICYQVLSITQPSSFDMLSDLLRLFLSKFEGCNSSTNKKLK